jgi:hypothetical protein
VTGGAAAPPADRRHAQSCVLDVTLEGEEPGPVRAAPTEQRNRHREGLTDVSGKLVVLSCLESHAQRIRDACDHIVKRKLLAASKRKRQDCSCHRDPVPPLLGFWLLSTTSILSNRVTTGR